MTNTPQQTFLIALGAGVISAVALLSSMTGPLPVRFAMLALATLPIALAGFTCNARAAMLAASFAAVALAIVNPAAGVRFAVAFAYPMAFLVYLSLLNRTDGSGQAEWYPLGRVILATLLIAATLIAASFSLLWTDLDALRGAMKTSIDTLIERGMMGLPGGGAMDDAQRSRLVDIGLVLMPGLLVGFWAAAALFNLWLAARISTAAGQLERPWPVISTFTYPVGTPILLAVSLLASLTLDGIPRLMALSVSGALYIAYILLGLAIIHHLTHGRPWRQPALSAMYVLLLAMSSFISLPLAVLGLSDSFFPLRRPNNDAAPPTLTS
jgi:hypothetical protein